MVRLAFEGGSGRFRRRAEPMLVRYMYMYMYLYMQQYRIGGSYRYSAIQRYVIMYMYLGSYCISSSTCTCTYSPHNDYCIGASY